MVYPKLSGFPLGKDMIKMIVYAVVFSNYEPSEVDSLWVSEKLAQSRADELDGHWNVERMLVRDKPISKEPK